ncbi:hypothetical protein [Mesorhizobium sp. Z1-4]|uniref:hypothetical protein n=1 Tax=Mesorhizobium sp. Z1-4 TaxID=2448478 RepID=UPI000FDAAFF8|nr:hypothetical protein [Mesorhizobium sp. Z1-4]
MRVNGTIQECIDNGYTIRAYCPNGHNKAIDLVALADRLGGDHSALRDALLPKLRCSKCGEKANAVIASPPSRADGWPERNR